VGEQPFAAIFAQAQNVPAFLEDSAGKIVQSILLARSGSNLLEARTSQSRGESANFIYPEFDLNFFVRCH
jgi:hypothetical protein